MTTIPEHTTPAPASLVAEPPSNYLLLQAADLAQILLTGAPVGEQYHSATPLFFKKYPSSSWQRIKNLRICQTAVEVLLEILISPVDAPQPSEVLILSSTYAPSSSIAISPNHPLLMTAPLLPAYMQKPCQPFWTRTSTTLDEQQSRSFVEALMEPYSFPADSFAVWSVPITLVLLRHWPTPSNPQATQLTMSYATPTHREQFGLYLPSCTSPLPTHHYCSLHQDLLIGLLLSKLIPPHTPLADPSSPWLVIAPDIYDDDDLMPAHLSEVQATPSSAAFHRLGSRNLLLYPNVLRAPPAWIGTMTALPERIALPGLNLNALFEDALDRPASVAIQEQLTKLVHMFQEAELLQISC